MTRRVKLLRVVRKHLIDEIVHEFSCLSLSQVERRIKAIQHLNKRLPHLTTPAPRISSQRKLFY